MVNIRMPRAITPWPIGAGTFDDVDADFESLTTTK